LSTMPFQLSEISRIVDDDTDGTLEFASEASIIPDPKTGMLL